jgi:hypothetical protein
MRKGKAFRKGVDEMQNSRRPASGPVSIFLICLPIRVDGGVGRPP